MPFTVASSEFQKNLANSTKVMIVTRGSARRRRSPSAARRSSPLVDHLVRCTRVEGHVQLEEVSPCEIDVVQIRYLSGRHRCVGVPLLVDVRVEAIGVRLRSLPDERGVESELVRRLCRRLRHLEVALEACLVAADAQLS